MTAHLAGPLRVNSAGSFATLAQDGPAEVAQSVALLALTRQGERRSEPEYGTPSPLFVGIDEPAVLAAISVWEPRADPATIDTVTGPDGQRIRLTPGGAQDVI